MPTSLDPPPADDEIECGRCGAYFYFELTRCPNCGANIYEPDDDSDQPDQKPSRPQVARPGKLGAWLEGFIRRLTNKPYPADELFGASINQAELFVNLLAKVGGDRSTVERLIEFERQQHPQGNRTVWLGSAIDRWERDNRISGADAGASKSG